MDARLVLVIMIGAGEQIMILAERRPVSLLTVDAFAAAAEPCFLFLLPFKGSFPSRSLNV